MQREELEDVRRIQEAEELARKQVELAKRKRAAEEAKAGGVINSLDISRIDRDERLLRGVEDAFTCPSIDTEYKAPPIKWLILGCSS